MLREVGHARPQSGVRSLVVLLSALLLAGLLGPVAAQAAPATCEPGQWTGEYFANKTLTEPSALVRCDDKVDFAWADAPEGVPVGADDFSVRWTTTRNFAAGSYRFDALADDGIRVWLDGQLLIDGWKDQPITSYTATADLTAGSHSVVVEFYEATELARVSVGWSPLSGPGSVDCSKGRVMSVIAHADDDLLFMNPSIQRAISDGKCVRTVAITAGDAGQTAAYWTGREAGHRASYAQMAGVADDWTFGDAGVAGRSILMATNTANPKVSLVWMRLPDGRENGAGFGRTGNVSLQKLWDGQVTSLRAVDGSSTYGRDQLRDALREMMTDFDATEIKAHNFVSGDGDHSDHFAAARFTQAATANGSLSGRLTGYIGYPTSALPENVAGADRTAKENAWYAYTPFDSLVCSTPNNCAGSVYASWLRREYPFGPSAPGAAWNAVSPTVLIGETKVFAYTCSDGSSAELSALPDWIVPAVGNSVSVSPQAPGSATVTVTCTDVVKRSGSASLTVTSVAAERPTPPAAERPNVFVKTPNKSKLRINVNPDLSGSKSWKVQILKKKKGTFVKVKTVRTQGPREIVTVDVPRGRYKARVPAQSGYQAATSRVVLIRR